MPFSLRPRDKGPIFVPVTSTPVAPTDRAREPEAPGSKAHSPPPATPDGPHIAVGKLCKNFGATVVLRDVELTVARGAIAVVIGGSGAGKTTLLKLLIGLDRPTSGSIHIAGHDIAPLSERELNEVRKKLGMVFQYSALLDSMNVLDNVAFPLREHRKQLSEKEVRTRVIEKLSALGLNDVEHKKPSELSGGMRKRVALARALMLEPEAIFYDEPTSGLDPLTARMVDEMIVETRDRFGVTSVVISHDMAGALRIADDIHLLDEGRLVVSGTPRELLQGNEPLVARFIEASGIDADRLLKESTPGYTRDP